MSQKLQSPPIDRRKASALEKQLRAMAPHFTPEWAEPGDDDSGIALIKIFSFVFEGVISRLNRAPFKNWVAFLDKLGIRLLPAVPSRVPIQFRVTQGTASEFLVPQRTRSIADATDDREELPFETEDNLWAIPGALAAVVAVDPSKDAIYKPPPGFLEQERVLPKHPPFKIQSFSSAESRTLQLDRTKEELEENDILRIRPDDQPLQQAAGFCAESGTRNAASTSVEDYVVQSLKGEIVTIDPPLRRDYPAGTRVERVIHFLLFEGKNRQQHILYLGDPDLFKIKSEAVISLAVTHMPGTLTGLQSLKLAWEYWGEQEDERGQKTEAWLPFEPFDGSGGLSRNGNVELSKPEGEIKEREINEIGSRWIRCRLDEAIPAPSTRLPQLESVQVLVESADKGLAPDLALSNDTPLEFPDLPFGSQPRTFDSFYIASGEVFSKKGGHVTLTVGVDPKGNVATPAVVDFTDASGNRRLRVFARGTGGRLLDLSLDPIPNAPNRPFFGRHNAPSDARIALESAPAAIADRSNIFVFFRTDDGGLIERFFDQDNDQWQWIGLTPPPEDVKVAFDASVVNPSSARPQVFATGSDGHLYSLQINPSSGRESAAWVDHEAPQDSILGSPPFATASDENGSTLQVFVLDREGRVHRWQESQGWDTLANGDGSSFAAGEKSRPFAHIYADGNDLEAKVFVRDSENRLAEYDTRQGQRRWVDLGQPDAGSGIGVDSDPAGFIEDAGTGEEQRHIFVRGSDNRLWERRSDPDQWVPHERPGDTDLRLSGGVLPYRVGDQAPQDFLSFFSATSRNTVAEYRMQISPYRDTAAGGPLETLILDSGASDNDGEYDGNFVHITQGPGADETLREISAYGGALKAVRLDPGAPWSAVPNQNSQYRILELVHQGKVQPPTSGGTGTSVDITLDKLAPGFTRVQAGMIIQAAGQLRVIDSFDPNSAVAQVTTWGTSPPGTGSAYQVFRVVREDSVDQAATRTIILGSDAVSGDDFYVGHRLSISQGPGSNEPSRRINGYSGNTRIALVDGAWGQHPENGSDLLVTPERASWLKYSDPDEVDLRPKLSWEYWNGSGWAVLEESTHKFKDRTRNLLIPGDVEFDIPENLDATQVAGQENYWIRARIVGGDYGRETFVLRRSLFRDEIQDEELVSHKSTIQPPRIDEVTIRYRLIKPMVPQYCLPFNNLEYLDQSNANRIDAKRFLPFQALPEDQPAIFLGFDKAFRNGPVRILLAADEIPVDDQDKPKLDWTFFSDNAWKELGFEDATEGLVKQEILELQIPEPFQKAPLFGDDFCWVKGSLQEGVYQQSPMLRGIFPNAVWSFQAETVRDEILGSSDGEAHQSFRFFKQNILPGEEIRVREVLTGEEREALTEAKGEDAIVERENDQGETETWVLWSEVDEFFDSRPDSRHYKLDRANGRLFFGDGKRGSVPAAGADNIQAFSYQAGGGRQGNVKAGEIATLVDAVAGVESVLNPVDAGGGSDQATLEQMLELGPAQISHRGRAVTTEDFEWLAREASREIVKVRCLANTRLSEGMLLRERGWVSLLIVPRSLDDKPQPSLELRHSVRRFLETRCDNGLSSRGRVVVGAPIYVEVSVQVDVYAMSIDVASKVESRARSGLRKFLHPLTGGPEGAGWEFGRDVAASDVYALLEDIEGVDHAQELRFSIREEEGERVGLDEARIPPNALAANGKHAISIRIAEER